MTYKSKIRSEFDFELDFRIWDWEFRIWNSRLAFKIRIQESGIKKWALTIKDQVSKMKDERLKI